MSKFYESDEFKRLNKTWSKKLKKSGFKDAEREDGSLTEWAVSFFRNKEPKAVWDAKQEYYRLAGHFLYEHSFKNRMEHIIWEHHCNGINDCKIDRITKHKRGKAQRVIKKLFKIMWLKYNNEQFNK